MLVIFGSFVSICSKSSENSEMVFSIGVSLLNLNNDFMNDLSTQASLTESFSLIFIVLIYYECGN